MPTERLRDTYADLLDGRDDAALTRLVGDLDRFHRPAPPPPAVAVAIERALEERVAGRRRHLVPLRPPPRQRRPPRRLGIILAATLAVALLAAAAPVVIPILERAFHMHPGTGRIVSQNLGTEVNLAQTVDGFTVTIERVYADANQIVIGYTVSGPAGRTFNNFGAHDHQGRRLPVLTDAAGHQFRHAPVSWGAGLEGGKGAYLLLFDASPIAGSPEQLALRLTIPALQAIERMGGAATPDQIPSASCQHDLCIYTVEGPFTFEFTVPFEPGRVVEPRQTVEVGGVPVSLERVVVTPTGTRVSLRGVGPSAELSLSVDGATYVLRPPGAVPARWTVDQAFDYVTPEALHDKRGEWTLVVNTGRDPGESPTRGGPWIFRFALP